MGTCRAVRLDAGAGQLAAIAPREMAEVLTGGDTIPVPLAPPFCGELLRWNDELLPVFDLAAWRGAPAADGPRLLAVVVYQERPGAPLRRGCLKVAAFPKVVAVDDDQACPLPDAEWKSLAVSCFRDEEGAAVPILSLAKVFHGGSVARWP